MTVETDLAAIKDEVELGWFRDVPGDLGHIVVGGSRAHGTSHADSDLDIRGFYVAPITAVLGLWGAVDTFKRDSHADMSLHELGKFADLSLSGAPTILESLATPMVLMSSLVGAELASNLDAFLSNRVRLKYEGYARQNFQLVGQNLGPYFSTRPERGRKGALHAFRLLEQGATLLRTGELVVASPDPDRLRQLSEMHPADITEAFAEELDRFKRMASVLPDEPDKERINRIVTAYRLAQASENVTPGSED